MLPDGGRSTSEDMWSRKRHFGTACNIQRGRYWGQFRNHLHSCHKQGNMYKQGSSDLTRVNIVEIIIKNIITIINNNNMLVTYSQKKKENLEIVSADDV